MQSDTRTKTIGKKEVKKIMTDLIMQHHSMSYSRNGHLSIETVIYDKRKKRDCKLRKRKKDYA